MGEEKSGVFIRIRGSALSVWLLPLTNSLLLRDGCFNSINSADGLKKAVIDQHAEKHKGLVPVRPLARFVEGNN